MEDMNLTNYYTSRRKLDRELRETHQEYDHMRYVFRWWVIGSIALLVLFSGGIAGGVYLGRAWYVLSIVSGIVSIIFLFYFFRSELNDGFDGPEKLSQALRLRKKVEELKNQQHLLEVEWKEGLATLKYSGYYQQCLVPQVIEEYRKQSRVNRTFHISLQLAIIFVSLLVTGLTSGLDTKLGWNIPWVAPILSFLVSLCTAITTFFKFRERSLHMQQTADAIEQEKTAFDLGIGPYRGVPPDATFAAFAERVEKLREEQRKAQQQLEQSSVSKEAQAGSA